MDISGNREQDHTQLRGIDLPPLLKRAEVQGLLEKKRAEVQRQAKAGNAKDPAANQDQAELEQADRDDLRLYFPLSSASVIPDLLAEVKPTKTSRKGVLKDMWDWGFELSPTVG